MRAIKSFGRGLSLALLTLVGTLTGCGQRVDTDQDGFPRKETLYLAGSQWGDPSTFNPLAESWRAAWPVGDRFNLMYEPLLTYNSLTGEVEPLLGTLVSQNSDKIVVDIHPAARWSDGAQVSAKDVKFVFELGHRFPGAATAFAIEFISAIHVDTVVTAGTKVERLSFLVDKAGRNNPLVILDLLQAIRIVPAHVFEPLLASHNNDLGEVQKLRIDSAPVVSGPYTLNTYTNEMIVLERRDDYWGNAVFHGGQLPAPRYIIHPIFKSNDAFSLALQKGQLDASQTYIPRIWLKKDEGIGTWFDTEPYYVSGSLPLILINCTKAPLSDPAFRRAMAAAIDYNDIRSLAVSGYAPPLLPGLIMPTGLEGRFFDSAASLAYGVPFSVDSAKKILADAGYRSVFKSDGTLDYMTDRGGNRLPTLHIKAPAGWSDWEAMVNIAVTGMREAGIDVREGFVDAGLYWPALPSGDFDLIMHKPAASITPSLPWSRFDAVMSSRNWKPIGGDNRMNENQGRYNQPGSPGYNARVDLLLRKIPLLTDTLEIRAAYGELNRIFMKDQPAIPLSYMPEQFYQFSNRVWTNWPTGSNPYAPPQLPWVSSGIRTLWQLRLASN